MARVKVDPECPHTVRRVRHMIKDRLGSEAATVFGEAIANVREHGEPQQAELLLHGKRFELRNLSCGRFHHQTNKPRGEGGYGLRIMERMGASLDTNERQCCVRWRKPNP